MDAVGNQRKKGHINRSTQPDSKSNFGTEWSQRSSKSTAISARKGFAKKENIHSKFRHTFQAEECFTGAEGV